MLPALSVRSSQIGDSVLEFASSPEAVGDAPSEHVDVLDAFVTTPFI